MGRKYSHKQEGDRHCGKEGRKETKDVGFSLFLGFEGDTKAWKSFKVDQVKSLPQSNK